MITSIIVMCILVFLAISVKGNFYKTLGQYLPSGFVVLSIDDAKFSKCPADLSSENCWVITLSQNRLGQHLKGYLKSDDIKEYAGKEPESDLIIDMTLDKQACEYQIKPSGTREEDFDDSISLSTPMVYRLSINKWTSLFCRESDILKHCKNPIKINGKPAWFRTAFQCGCIDIEKSTGAIAYKTIESPYVHTISTISVNKDGNIKTATVDTKSSIQQKIGGVAYIVWDGYLVDRVCPTKEPYYAFYDNGWHVGDSTAYENYKTAAMILFSKLSVDKNGRIYGDVESFVNKFNIYADNALKEVSFGSIDNPMKMDGAYIVHDLEYPVYNPVYTLYVDADYWLKIYQPIGVPKIIDVYSQRFKTTGKIIAIVKNEGEGEQFSFYAICDHPFSPEPTKTVYINKDDVKTLELEITANTNKPVEKNCNFCVEGVGGKVCKKVKVAADPYTVCTPNSLMCIYKNGFWHVEQCNEYGSGSEVVRTCAYDEVCENGQCKKKPSCNHNGVCEKNLGENEISCPSDCVGFDSGLDKIGLDKIIGIFKGVIKIIIFIIISVLVIMFIVFIYKTFKFFKKVILGG